MYFFVCWFISGEPHLDAPPLFWPFPISPPPTSNHSKKIWLVFKYNYNVGRVGQQQRSDTTRKHGEASRLFRAFNEGAGLVRAPLSEGKTLELTSVSGVTSCWLWNETQPLCPGPDLLASPAPFRSPLQSSKKKQLSPRTDEVPVTQPATVGIFFLFFFFPPHDNLFKPTDAKSQAAAPEHL